jgi:predicted flap endonuclease-1-like 5' DNA nuclease
MNPLFAFFLGLLIGWLVEWLIDYFYWRRRYAEKGAAPMAANSSPGGMARTASVERQPAEESRPDNLQKIKGIGPVIEGKLNAAGIYTFEQLGALTTADLRGILGSAIERLADEESLLKQARDLARQK